MVLVVEVLAVVVQEVVGKIKRLCYIALFFTDIHVKKVIFTCHNAFIKFTSG